MNMSELCDVRGWKWNEKLYMMKLTASVPSKMAIKNTFEEIDIERTEMETWMKWKLINPFALIPREVSSVFIYKCNVYFVCFTRILSSNMEKKKKVERMDGGERPTM